ncbi:hypothetical protein ACFS07_13465 [Undibacterium arcticum]
MRATYDSAGTWPLDAVAVTDADEAMIRAGLATGATVSGASGAWVVTPPAPPPPPTSAALWSAYQAKAQLAINKSDITMLRCVENGVAVPAAWPSYRKALRAILNATSGDPTLPLPMQPAYPAGT